MSKDWMRSNRGMDRVYRLYCKQLGDDCEKFSEADSLPSALVASASSSGWTFVGEWLCAKCAKRLGV